MNFDLSDEQKMLAQTARKLLEEKSTYDNLRRMIDANEEIDRHLWGSLSELGFLGASIPEDFGGLGLDELDLGVICEELGRANAAIPFFSSIVLAAEAIKQAGNDDQKNEYLPALAAGEKIGCFAYAEGQVFAVEDQSCFFQGGKLSGQKSPVADAGIADFVIVLARDEANKAVLLLVELNQSGVQKTKINSFDQLRAHYKLEFNNADVIKLDGAEAGAVLNTIFDYAATMAAFEAVGGSERAIEMARDYAQERQIFGRALASYQSIKHILADAKMLSEMAKSNAYYAAWAAQNDQSQLPVAAAAARLSAIDAFEFAARENLQVHGGIGYTFETNCHFYYRRERTLALSLGGRERWADRLINNLGADILP